MLLWELGGRRDAAQERRALHLLALAFFAVAAYVAVASSEELAAAREPDTTPGGLIATAIAALALPLLIVGKCRLARRTGSLTLWSDVDKTRLLRIAGVGTARVGGTQRGAWLVVYGSSRRARDAGLRCGRDSRIWTRRARSPVTGRYLARAAEAHPEAPGRRAGCAAAQPASAPAYTCRASALLAPRLSIT